MILEEFKNKTFLKPFKGIKVKDASGFDLFEYNNINDFKKDTKYNNKKISDFLINQNKILIIYVYEF